MGRKINRARENEYIQRLAVIALASMCCPKILKCLGEYEQDAENISDM